MVFQLLVMVTGIKQIFMPFVSDDISNGKFLSFVLCKGRLKPFVRSSGLWCKEASEQCHRLLLPLQKDWSASGSVAKSLTYLPCSAQPEPSSIWLSLILKVVVALKLPRAFYHLKTWNSIYSLVFLHEKCLKFSSKGMLSNYKECVPMQKSCKFFYEVNLPLTYRQGMIAIFIWHSHKLM